MNSTRVLRTQARPTLTLILLLASGAIGARASQERAKPHPLQPLDFLIGRWEGTSDGKPGAGKVEREYIRVLGGRFLQVKNRSIYPPQPKNPKGEQHEDVGFVSFDGTRKQFVLRQFHIEGFVNQYVADAPAKPGLIVFTTEAIENIPAGWRARETYTLRGSAELEEVFELAEPSKEFELYSRTRLKRRSD